MRALLLTLLLVVAACSAPAVVFPDDTPEDFAELAEAVFEDFVAAFPDQRECIGKAEIRVAWELDDRALYDPENDVVTVRVPATAPHLTSSIVHELGHRLEFRCPSQRDVRRPFLEALGLDPETAWSDRTTYETSPSEMWAEAVIRHVLGRPDSRRPLQVTPAAVHVVADWAGVDLNHEPSAP